jgi:hypothetical protein
MKAFGLSVWKFGVVFAIAAISLGVIAAPNARNGGVKSGANPAAAAEPMLKGTAAFGDWRADHPGVTRMITAADLPKPYASASARNQPRVVPQPAGAMPQVLPGFRIERIASGIRRIRLL